MKQYDYLIVGAGLYGATFANRMSAAGKRCLVIDKRSEVGGNCATERKYGITVHKYGAHIFHTNDKEVWSFVNQFAQFKQFQNNVKAIYEERVYSLPFNMNTFEQVFGTTTPDEAKKVIEAERSRVKLDGEPKNLEEQALSLVGPIIYKCFIKDYTEKQWGRACNELPPDIIKRLPLRFTYDNNYFNDFYQGLPICGYTKLVENMLEALFCISNIEVQLNTDFYSKSLKDWLEIADNIVFTGAIDEFFNYKFGELEWRSLTFKTTELSFNDNYQGCPVMNYCDKHSSHTRIIEHKHFLKEESPATIITAEYPQEYKRGLERYYPINNERNNTLYQMYAEEAAKLKNIIFGGRLGTYKYLDMDKVIRLAMDDVRKELYK